MKSKKTKRLDSPAGQALMFVVLLAISYVFISLALDSAHLLEYLLGIVFLVWAAKSLIRSIKLAVGRG